MKHLTLISPIFGRWIRIGMGCVLDVRYRGSVRWIILGWAHSHPYPYYAWSYRRDQLRPINNRVNEMWYYGFLEVKKE